jgi:NAD(P)-dependent dehydrogenase (short-subunit alcohol dehydrogenase family)
MNGSTSGHQRVFITGGASGLGHALALQYAAQGWRVLIGDLNLERCVDTLVQLRAVSPASDAVACDVTLEAHVQAAADWLHQHWGGVDVVINNAGVAQMGGIADVSEGDWQWIVNINLLGVARGCRVFTPMLRAQGGGQLVNIASMAGLVHMPQAAAYNATKAAVVALSETLQLELEVDNIGVTVVCPAFFRTALARNMRASDPRLEAMTKRLVERARIGPEQVARQVFEGVQRRDSHILTHPEARRAWLFKRVLPYAFYKTLMRRQLAGVQARMQRKAAT